ncbi:MAG TPA: SAM-dependent chlorinase/fluorinase [Solirubrobacterales bacterium]|nr:SAM-dependent chlorinase/fluorinase [Solirubrobacterales bacterium]
MPRPITFLSDYGNDDEFAGVCRAVIAKIAPGARVIDLTHGIRRHDVAHGAAVLANAVAYAPDAVHLAVVDPGVGTGRAGVAVAAADGENWFVGPDNGLLWPALERCGGSAAAVEISNSPAGLEPVSATFHGRDLFAPVAARLALGAELGALGEPLDGDALVRIERSEATVEPGRRLEAQVSHVDAFGNVSLVATAADADDAGLEVGKRLRVRAARGEDEARYALTFADAEAGQMVLLVDSAHSLALAVNKGDAAGRLELGAGDRVELTPM